MKGDWDDVPAGQHFVVTAKRYLRRTLSTAEMFVTFADINVIDYRETHRPMRTVVYIKVRQFPEKLFMLEHVASRLENKVRVYHEETLELVMPPDSHLGRLTLAKIKEDRERQTP